MKLSPGLILLVCAATFVVTMDAHAQQCTHQTIGPVTQTAAPFMTKYSGDAYTSQTVECQVEPNSYVRLLNNLGQH
jgi:hypothetical protein